MSCLASSFENNNETSCLYSLLDSLLETWRIPIPVTPPPLLATAFGTFLTVACILLGYLQWKRYSTRQRLLQAGLPTVYWRPKFVNYLPSQQDNNNDIDSSLVLGRRRNQKLLPASTITNILPRMKRLKGPFDMYGTVYGISTAVVHVADPVPAAAILSRTRSYSNNNSSGISSGSSSTKPTSALRNASGVQKAPAYNHFKNFCGNGVFTADGQEWKQKRAVVMHALLKSGSDNIGFEKQVEQQADTAANRLIESIESLRDMQCPHGRVETNVVPLLQRATIGLIFRYITHSDIGMDGTIKDATAAGLSQQPKRQDAADENDTVSTDHSVSSLDSAAPVPQGKLPAEPSLLSSYLQSITRIRMIILAQSRSVWFLLPRWCYRTFASMYQEEERTMGPIREFAALACCSAQPGSPLAALRENPIYKSVGDESTTSASKNLLDEVITLLFAGQDTSAATLSWTLHLLSLYPAVQQKVADEVLSVLGGAADTTVQPFVTKKLISSMPYLDAVIKESMRLYPVAPFVVRNLSHPVSIIGDNDAEEDDNDSSSKSEKHNRPTTTLPAGSIACIWIYGLHRNPRYWKRPDEFLPERWLSPPQERDAGISAGAYMPFAVGPRNCVGQPLATIILRSLLARLLHRYEFRCNELDANNAAGAAADPKSLRKDMQAGFTVLPQDGVRLGIHPRCLP